MPRNWYYLKYAASGLGVSQFQGKNLEFRSEALSPYIVNSSSGRKIIQVEFSCNVLEISDIETKDGNTRFVSV
jgi:hypothetical protein